MDYQDRIGDRLNNPEAVPAEYRHLIPDDVQRVERILSIPVSGRVLDVGCSDGAITRRIAEEWGVQADGYDLNPGYARWVADIRYGDLLPTLDMLGESLYDAVYACEVFEHLTDADADQALTNILAVLKPGGDLIVTVPNRYPADLYEVGCRARWAWPDHRSAYTHGKLDEWLRPHFATLSWLPLYEHDEIRYQAAGMRMINESIWLICHAKGKL